MIEYPYNYYSIARSKKQPPLLGKILVSAIKTADTTTISGIKTPRIYNLGQLRGKKFIKTPAKVKQISRTRRI